MLDTTASLRLYNQLTRNHVDFERLMQELRLFSRIYVVARSLTSCEVGRHKRLVVDLVTPGNLLLTFEPLRELERLLSILLLQLVLPHKHSSVL